MQQLPLLVPESSWEVSSGPPSLTGVDVVAIDLETKDDGLASDHGPGWAIGAGHIAGVCAAWRQGADMRSVYLPIRHPDTQCLDPSTVGAWLRTVVRSGRRLVFQNAPYDLGWIGTEMGIDPPTLPDDTTAMAVMLDENRWSFGLDEIARWRGIPGKDEALLREAAAAYGYEGNKEVKSNLWRLPARYVGAYGAGDAEKTLLCWESMLPDIGRDNVEDAYALECELIPMVLAMRRRGIRLDVDGAHQAMDKLYAMRDDVLSDLSHRLGRTATIRDISSPKWLEMAHDAEGVTYPRTPKTRRGSFKAGKTGWMLGHKHWLPSLVARARKYDSAASKFVQSYLLDYAHKGRLHATVNQFRGEDGGTRSHRMSYSDPPLQQMPERDPEIGPLIRSLFLPEDGEIWGAHDYSQQEYRMIVHAGCLLRATRAEEAAQLYHDDPNTDFHGLVVDWTGLDRKSAKDTNFAKAFGAGVPKFATMIGRTREEAKEIYDQYDRELPFVSESAGMVNKLAARRGYIRLIDGARCHFDKWDGGWIKWEALEQARKEGHAVDPCSLPEARRRQKDDEHPWHGRRLVRAETHKAFNRFVQGSAARQTKLAMRNCWRAGYTPLLQMHDEMDYSHSDERQGREINKIMVDAYELRVPTVVDSEYGLSWGDAKHRWRDVR